MPRKPRELITETRAKDSKISPPRHVLAPGLAALGLLTDVCWMEMRMCLGWLFCPSDQPAFWEGLLAAADVLFPCGSGWLPDAGGSVALAGCHKAAAAAQHLLAPGSATRADVTLINPRCCCCAKVNSPRSSDINISLLAEREGLLHYSEHGSGSQKCWHLSLPWAMTLQHDLVPDAPALIFPSVKMGLWTLRDPLLKDCLLTCRAVIFPVYCWLDLLHDLEWAAGCNDAKETLPQADAHNIIPPWNAASEEISNTRILTHGYIFSLLPDLNLQSCCLQTAAALILHILLYLRKFLLGVILLFICTIFFIYSQ